MHAKEYNYKVGDKVLLNVKLVDPGDNKKFTSKFRGPFRIIKVFINCTVDIADSSYKEQSVHVNRLKGAIQAKSTNVGRGHLTDFIKNWSVGWDG